MELTLKRFLEDAEFSQSKRGYDRDEVDDFLDRAVAMATKVEAKLTQTMQEARRTTFGPTSFPAKSDAEVEAEIERRVQSRLGEAVAAAVAEATAEATSAPPLAPRNVPSEEEHAEEMRRTLVLAQRTADAAIREAREEAEKLRAEADREVSALRAEAEQEVQQRRSGLDRELAEARDAANKRVREEIAELEGVREALRADVGVLERHVEEQRNQLRSSVGELQRLLDDPAGFRLAPTPALLDPVVPPIESSPADAPEGVGDADEPAEEVVEDPAGVDAISTETDEAESAPAAPVSDQSADQGGLSFGDVVHEPPSLGAQPPLSTIPPLAARPPLSASPPPSGPPTEEISTTGDPFMDELRKAMSDDQPLGPREDSPEQTGSDPAAGFDDDRRGWRFGRRR